MGGSIFHQIHREGFVLHVNEYRSTEHELGQRLLLDPELELTSRYSCDVLERRVESSLASFDTSIRSQGKCGVEKESRRKVNLKEIFIMRQLAFSVTTNVQEFRLFLLLLFIVEIGF